MSALPITEVRVDGVEDWRRLLDGPYTICVPLGSDAPKGYMHRVSIGEVVLRAGELSADVRVRTGTDADGMSFMMKLETDARQLSFRSEREVLSGDVYRLARGDVSDYRLTGRNRFAVVSLSTDLLLKQCDDDSQRDDVAFWERNAWFRAPWQTRSFAVEAVRRIVAHVSQPTCSVSGQALLQLQSDLIEAFLCGILWDERRAPEQARLSSAAIVRRVEDWVQARPPEVIQIADLCRAVAVSRRTLQRAFTETLGLGPSRYLTRRRLSAARVELRQGEPAASSVSEIATKYGFWELGRFAQQYRQMFGETPSGTLAKVRPGDRISR